VESHLNNGAFELVDAFRRVKSTRRYSSRMTPQRGRPPLGANRVYQMSISAQMGLLWQRSYVSCVDYASIVSTPPPDMQHHCTGKPYSFAFQLGTLALAEICRFSIQRSSMPPPQHWSWIYQHNRYREFRHHRDLWT
jgi:hypothetical protein